MALVRVNIVALALNETIGRGKNVVANARVVVRYADDSLATIYSDEAGTIEIPIPTKCDKKGELGFWIEEGAYKFRVSGGAGGGVGTWHYRTVSAGGGGGAVYTFASGISPYLDGYWAGPAPFDTGDSVSGVHNSAGDYSAWSAYVPVRGSMSASSPSGLPSGYANWHYGYTTGYGGGDETWFYICLPGATGSEVFTLTGAFMLATLNSATATFYSSITDFGTGVFAWNLTSSFGVSEVGSLSDCELILTFS